MLCPSCQQNCRDTAVLCIHCGATLSTASASDAEKPTWDIAGAALHDVAETSLPTAANTDPEPLEEAPSNDYRQVNYFKADSTPQPPGAAEPSSPPPSSSAAATKTSSRTSGVWVFILMVAVVAYRFGKEDSADSPPTEAPAAAVTTAQEAPPDAAPVEAAPVEDAPVTTETGPLEENAAGTGSGLYLNITNATSYVIGRIYVSPSSATSWGEDKLGSEVLPQGNTIRIPLDEYTEVSFDVMLCDGDGDAYKYPAFDVSKGDIVARDGDLDGKCT